MIQIAIITVVVVMYILATNSILYSLKLETKAALLLSVLFNSMALFTMIVAAMGVPTP